MKKLCCFLINSFLFPCLAVAIVGLFCLYSGQALGNDINISHKAIISPPEGNTELITNGIYGPFSPFYFPSLSTSTEVCNLVNGDFKDGFTVICFPAKTVVGTLLAETDKTEIIQAQLFAVNNGLNDRPLPELIVSFPLADMEQEFFTKDIIKRLLRINSIFDETCKLTYQVDGKPQKSEDWLCSSFLKYFDKYTGQPRLYYELHIRPLALQVGSNKNVTADTSKDLFKFFKNLKSGKALNIKVDLLNDELTLDSTLDLTSHDKWINRLLDVYFIDKPTIDTSGSDEMANQLPKEYPADNKAKQQDATGDTQISERIYGPFNMLTCQVNRYVQYMYNNTYHQSLYPDMFLVDCNQTRRHLQVKWPAWIFQIGLPKDFKKFSTFFLGLEKDDISVTFSRHDVEPSSFISISDQVLYSGAITRLTYTVSAMPLYFFNSKVIQDTLHSTGRLETPCTISYSADGKQLSEEKLKCNLSYQVVSDTIMVDIDVDYGFIKCYQLTDKSCQKDALIKAVSFLREIKDIPQKIEMKIEFEGAEIATTDLDLSNFDLAEIRRLLKRVDSLN